MYRLNLLDRNVLVTPDEVIRHAPTKHTLDHRMIENSIIIAEERFIRPALTHAYYEAMIAEKNKVVTEDNKATLEAQINASLPEGSAAVTLTAGQVVNALEYLSADNQSLWKQFLWKVTAECVLLLAYPEGYVQFGSSGVIHENAPAGPMTSGGIVAPDLRSVKWAMDKKLQDRIDPLLQSMHFWICKQKEADSSKYSLYDKYCDCDVNGIAYKRKTDVILGAYNDDENETCCR